MFGLRYVYLRVVLKHFADLSSQKGTLSLALSSPFQAIDHYENSLSYWPDHAEGIVGLSNLLMDIFEEKMPAEEPEPSLLDHLASSSPSISTLNANLPPPLKPARDEEDGASDVVAATGSNDPSPAQLNRLAARDRAYMLLSTLAKLGSGAGNAEAWLALARSYELSGQMEKAKKALWWVVRLEEVRGVRAWSCVGPLR